MTKKEQEKAYNRHPEGFTKEQIRQINKDIERQKKEQEILDKKKLEPIFSISPMHTITTLVDKAKKMGWKPNNFKK